MFIHTINFLARGDIMESMKAVAYMAMGSVATIMFQKYRKPMMKAMQNAVNKEK